MSERFRGVPDDGLSAIITSMENWCLRLEEAEHAGAWADVEHLRRNMSNCVLSLKLMLEQRAAQRAQPAPS